jgi:signal transduction histidine kinase
VTLPTFSGVKIYMKKKLNIIFVLMAVSLFGIIVFQIYWSVNAYRANKEKFDVNINVAMQKAMDDCKKDYFDSIRRVLIKRLSLPETRIRIDTIFPSDPKFKTLYASYNILFFHDKVLPGEPYRTSNSNLDYYRKKIDHNATLPEVLTEMSFYVPPLMAQITKLLSEADMHGPMFTEDDIRRHPELFRNTFFKGKSLAQLVPKYQPSATLPPFYQHIRDTALVAYFKHNPQNELFTGKKPSAPPVIPQLSGLPASKKNIGASLHKSGYKAGFEAAMLAMQNTILGAPHNYQMADSLKLYRYFKKELEKIHIYSPFSIVITKSTSPPSNLNLHYSQTDEIDYKYFGFRVFGYGPPDFFFRAKFTNPQYSVIKGMLFTLSLALFLVLFIIFCFNYIFKTFIEQKKLAELKDDFINNMTHELKTPIATITVAIEGLQKFNALNDTEKTQRYLQTSRNELSRLNDLVTKVLDIATFENKHIVLIKERINIQDLLNEVVLSEKAKTEKTTDITLNIGDNLEFVNADKIHFRNVLVNLVDNAIKYAVEPVKIKISCYKQGVNMILSVQDNGIGIPPVHINHVFDKFHRVPTGNVHSVKGTGLGLSYVKYIVEAHGGSVSVKSEMNKGSEFIVSIPLNNG